MKRKVQIEAKKSPTF